VQDESEDMTKEFPLDDVRISEVASCRQVENPAFSSEGWQVSSDAFSMQVEQVGSFYAAAGAEAEFSVLPGADRGWVRLYLNGQILVALLHQRGVITFHASSFVHDGCGVMVLGESGAGKSSLAASFALGGAGLLTDDITPLVIKEEAPHIKSLHSSIRIRRNTSTQLNIDGGLLREAESGTEKQYMSARREGVTEYPLHVIMKVEIGDVSSPVFDEPSPAEKFAFLRSEICMSEILAGMPETETGYLHQIVRIIEKVRFMRVIRPAEIRIKVLYEAVRGYLEGKNIG